MNKRVLSNSLWMMSEKIISIFGLIFVTSFVAKYVGPKIFGDIAFSLSIFQLVQVFSQLGSDVLIFKRVSKNKISGRMLISATIPVRFFIYMTLSSLVVIYQYVNADIQSFYFILAAFLSCLCQAMDTYSIFYDATLNSKVNTFVNMVGLVISLLIRYVIAHFELNPYWLCVPIILSSLLPLVIRMLFYYRDGLDRRITKKYRAKYTRYLVLAGSTFVISSISVAIYTRLSILVLGVMEGKSSVGLFSVAATLATSWSFILNSIVTSSLPSIFSEKNQASALLKSSKINLVIILISVPILIAIFVLAGWGINYFYGPQYQSSIILLKILSFSTILAALGTVSSRFIVYYSGYLFLSKKMLSVVFFSVVFNIVFIHFYGVIGASVANILTEVVSLTFLNYFFLKGIVFKMHLSTFKFKNIFGK